MGQGTSLPHPVRASGYASFVPMVFMSKTMRGRLRVRLAQAEAAYPTATKATLRLAVRAQRGRLTRAR